MIAEAWNFWSILTNCLKTSAEFRAEKLYIESFLGHLIVLENGKVELRVSLMLETDFFYFHWHRRHTLSEAQKNFVQKNQQFQELQIQNMRRWLMDQLVFYIFPNKRLMYCCSLISHLRLRHQVIHPGAKCPVFHLFLFSAVM